MIKKQQLNLFSCSEDSKKKHQKEVVWRLCIDGASRKNPGIAGAGICLFRKDNLVGKRGFYLGHKTNNQAEYLALIIGICYFRKYAVDDVQSMLHIISDSELLVRQLQGKYKVKDPFLKILYTMALELLDGFKYAFFHVMREQNIEADEMANQGIDTKKILPEYLIQLFKKYDIYI